MVSNVGKREAEAGLKNSESSGVEGTVFQCSEKPSLITYEERDVEARVLAGQVAGGRAQQREETANAKALRPSCLVHVAGTMLTRSRAGEVSRRWTDVMLDCCFYHSG